MARMSQDIADANCAASRDGGTTFGPAVPMYSLLDCGGLHGHIKVAPDGTVYVPNSSCTSGSGGSQGIAPRHQESRHTIVNQLRYPANPRRHDWLTVGHGLGNHPTEKLFPFGELANNVRGLVDAFAKRIQDQSGPGNVISDSHRHGILHEEHFFELAAEMTVAVEFVVSDEEADKLLALLRQERVSIFYARASAEFGAIEGDR